VVRPGCATEKHVVAAILLSSNLDAELRQMRVAF
jgi:hypothetical protein